MSQSAALFNPDEFDELPAFDSQDTLKRLSAMAKELAARQEEKEGLENALEALKTEINDLSMNRLPKLFDEVSTDRIGVPDQEVDAVVSPYVFASIRKEWTQEQRQAAFAEVVRLGGEDLLKTTITVSFPAGREEEAKILMESLSESNLAGDAEISLDHGIHHGTLTSLLKEQLEVERDEPIKLTTLGATVGRVCKLVKRRSTTTKRKK